MYDFLKVDKEWNNKLQRNVYTPSFVINSHIKDLLVRGNKFYAIYNYNTGLWETDDSKATALIDEQVIQYVNERESVSLKEDPEHGPLIRLIAHTSNHLINTWHNFCEKDYRPFWNDKYQLNQKVIFSNQEPKREDYATVKLPYPLQEGPTPCYDRICEVLYLPSEVEKWEWYIGCILAGEHKKIQKMVIFYGEPGTGKSTIMGEVIAKGIFNGINNGYVTRFEANGLTGNDSFGTQFLENDAVLAYDDEAEMNLITKKAMLNKIISHENITVNPKFGRRFTKSPNVLLMAGSNEPVQLSPTSGMNRRLIDIRPTGNKLPPDEYDRCVEGLEFERSGIAYKCLQTYKRLGRHYYDRYVAEDMLSRTSPFQNFVSENYFLLKDGISLANAYKLYIDYAAECNFKNVLARFKFRDTLKLYYTSYDNMKFEGFKAEKIGIKSQEEDDEEESEETTVTSWIDLKEQDSIFDQLYSDFPAQYEQDDKDHPLKYAWVNCKTKLKELDTHKIHYVKVPLELIVIDFDVRNEDGTKNLQKNIEMASKWPATYTEVSKSGGGIHLHYIYTGGDLDKLSRIYSENVEIKIFNGGASLRRKLTLCNNLPIAELSSGLPFKEGGNKMIDWKEFRNELDIKKFIVACIQKKHHGHTKPEMDFIFTKLEQCYRSGMSYDVRDVAMNVFDFAVNSTNKADYCMDLYRQMHFCSKDIEEKANAETEDYKNAPIIFLDCEIFPSYKQAKELGMEIPDYIPEDTPALFLVNWKFQGKNKPVIRMINPKPHEVEELFRYRYIGFNNRSYDNHMLYARAQGYTSEELYNLSRALVSKDKNISQKAKFAPAYNISYADIYDFASNDHKKSLKKWEIELAAKDPSMRHLEWNHDWNLPVPVKDWPKVAEYCDNDVLTTERVFEECKGDYIAREMLADLADGTANDTTNKLSTKFVKGDADHLELVYTDFTTGKQYQDGETFTIDVITEEQWRALGDDWTGVKPNNINHFPGYHLVLMSDGKLHNMYRGIDVGRGGLVIANPGMYGRAVTKDVASMHPHSIVMLNLFGKQTVRYADIMEARIHIKHGEFDAVKQMFNGKLAKYLDDPDNADALSTALKLILNSFYGMTSSPNDYFEAKDSRNINNIVALRGALVMKTLQDEVEARGFKVIHIKTDSIKIENPTDEILKFIDDFGAKYGYTYEVEHTWEKICLKDDAQFIGKHDLDDPDYVKNPQKSEKKYPGRWEATGKYFQVPYIFKTLFTHQEITFEDMCEIINVKEGTLHLIFNEGTDKEVDQFVGRVGQFTPVLENGGNLYRVNEGKRYAASGSKGYQWLESDSIRNSKDEIKIDTSYYKVKVNKAIEILKSFGDYEWFVA